MKGKLFVRYTYKLMPKAHMSRGLGSKSGSVNYSGELNGTVPAFSDTLKSYEGSSGRRHAVVKSHTLTVGVLSSSFNGSAYYCPTKIF